MSVSIMHGQRMDFSSCANKMHMVTHDSVFQNTVTYADSMSNCFHFYALKNLSSGLH